LSLIRFVTAASTLVAILAAVQDYLRRIVKKLDLAENTR
jgi:hypothetical protein